MKIAFTFNLSLNEIKIKILQFSTLNYVVQNAVGILGVYFDNTLNFTYYNEFVCKKIVP